jgi:endonuclease YncB( thermonuclease family)
MRRRILAAAAAIAIAVIAYVMAPPPESARADELHDVRVIDGDTIRAAEITYRVVNIDTPEVGGNARCDAERQAGRRATQRTRALIEGARRVETRNTGRTDRYGRVVAFVLVDGRDLGDTLIAEGLARPWRGRREPWCGAGGEFLP